MITMKIIRFSIYITLVLGFCTVISYSTHAQTAGTSQPTIHFKGFTQMYFSYAEANGDGDSPYGFTLRRLRFKPYGQFSENLSWGFQLSYDRQALKLLDVYLQYKISPFFSIKTGQFAVPGSKSGALADELFSTTKMALIERATITQKWLGYSGLYAYRGFGVQLDGHLLDNKLYYGLMASNPKGNGIFTPSVKMDTYTHDENGLTLWARAEYKPVDGIGIGAFVGNGQSSIGDTITVVRNSYGAHFFMRKNNITLLTEYIAGESGQEDNELNYSGLFFDFAYRLNNFEPAIRFAFYEPDGGDAVNGIEKNTNYTLGLNYYFNKNVKIQANYILKNEQMANDADELDNNLFYINLQHTFKD